MAQSLRDQLLKIGLVDKKQANQAKKISYKKNKEQERGRIQPSDESKLHAQRALAEKKKQARSANRRQREEAQKNEKIAYIRQLIADNRLKLKDGDIAYRFTDDNRIVRIFVPTREMVDDLSRGILAIVREKRGYAVVPAVIADKVREWDANLVILYNGAPRKATTDPDDPYAAYTVPDDLFW